MIGNGLSGSLKFGQKRFRVLTSLILSDGLQIIWKQLFVLIWSNFIGKLTSKLVLSVCVFGAAPSKPYRFSCFDSTIKCRNGSHYLSPELFTINNCQAIAVCCLQRTALHNLLMACCTIGDRGRIHKSRLIIVTFPGRNGRQLFYGAPNLSVNHLSRIVN